MQNLPFVISLVFIVIVLLTFYFASEACRNNKKVLILLSIWLLLIGILSVNDVFKITDRFPPRIMISVFAWIVVIIAFFFTKAGKFFIDTLEIRWITILHIIRFPVELILFWLFTKGAVPKEMTFEGGNLDILSGITAPIVFYFAFVRKSMSNKTVLAWNLICLILLMNIVVRAILSLPTPFQKIGMLHPNIAVLHFPFTLLPAFIVPIVLFAHLAAIRQLIKK